MRKQIIVASVCIGLLPGCAFASVYDFMSTETSGLGNPSFSFALDTSTAVAGAGGTSFSGVSIDENGTITTGNTVTLVSANELASPLFFFVDTDVPGPKAFASGSGADVTFNPGTFSIADGFTDGEGHLVISTASAIPEPASYALMIMGVAGIGVVLRRLKRTSSMGRPNAA